MNRSDQSHVGLGSQTAQETRFGGVTHGLESRIHGTSQERAWPYIVSSSTPWPGRRRTFELLHAAPLPELIEGIMAGRGITLCMQCAARRDSRLPVLPPSAPLSPRGVARNIQGRVHGAILSDVLGEFLVL